MKKLQVYEEEFYRGYGKSELYIIREDLDLIETMLDNNDLSGALRLLRESSFKDIPEFVFFQINILLRLRKVEEARILAYNSKYDTFNPIIALRKGIDKYLSEQKLTTRVVELEFISGQAESESKKSDDKVVLKDINKTESVVDKKSATSDIQAKLAGSSVDSGRKKKVIKPDVSKASDDDSEKVYSISDERRTIFTRIYADDITLDEIKEANIDPFIKNILIICYYEKYNKAKGVKFIKSIKGSALDYQKKIYNELLIRLENKKIQFFDIGIYAKILKMSINSSLAMEILNRKAEAKRREEEEKQERYEEMMYQKERRKKLKEKEEREKKKKAVFVTSMEMAGRRDIPKKKPTVQRDLTTEAKKEKKEPSNNQALEDLTIKEAFPNETLLMGAYLYYLMNVNKAPVYIKQFDTFYHLIEKSVTDRHALDLFEYLVYLFEQDKRTKVTYNAESFQRLRKK